MASSLCRRRIYHPQQRVIALQIASTWCSVALLFIWVTVLTLVGTVSEWERGAGYSCAHFQWAGILAFADYVSGEALLTLLLRGQMLRQIFAFSRTVGSGVGEKSQTRHSLPVFLKCFSLHLNWVYST